MKISETSPVTSIVYYWKMISMLKDTTFCKVKKYAAVSEPP